MMRLFDLMGSMIAVLGMLCMFAQTAAAYPTVEDGGAEGGCRDCHATYGDLHNPHSYSCLTCHVATQGDTPETSACTSCHLGGGAGSEQLQTLHIESANVPGGSCFPCHADATDVYGNISGDAVADVPVFLYEVICGAVTTLSTLTDIDGYYSFDSLPNGRYIVAPDETGYIFSSGFFIDIPQGTIQPYDFTSTGE